MASNLQKPNYTEETVSLMVQLFVSLMTFPLRRFSLEPFSRHKEKTLGADAKLRGSMLGFRPFYMQFKAPEAYPSHSSSAVIRDRKSLGLSTAPRVFFFKLRDRAKHHPDFQHNVLLRLDRHLQGLNIGRAAYVCPLFTERDMYHRQMQRTALVHFWRYWLGLAWGFQAVSVQVGGRKIPIDRVPTLSNHVCIPPHANVTSANHRYSFNRTGEEVCFHSPQTLPEGSSSLADWLRRILKGADLAEPAISRETAYEEFKHMLHTVEPGPMSAFDSMLAKKDGVAAWLSWGDFVEKNYGIQQFALVRWKD